MYQTGRLLSFQISYTKSDYKVYSIFKTKEDYLHYKTNIWKLSADLNRNASWKWHLLEAPAQVQDAKFYISEGYQKIEHIV